MINLIKKYIKFFFGVLDNILVIWSKLLHQLNIAYLKYQKNTFQYKIFKFISIVFNFIFFLYSKYYLNFYRTIEKFWWYKILNINLLSIGILFLLLYFLIDNKNKIVIGIVIIIILFIYKRSIIFINKNPLILKGILKKYNSLNILVYIYCNIFNIWYIWLYIKNVLQYIIKNIRYKLRKKIFLLNKIDTIYYIIIIIIEESIDLVLKFMNKYKKKIKKKSYITLVLWRINILLFNVFVLSKVLLYFNIVLTVKIIILLFLIYFLFRLVFRVLWHIFLCEFKYPQLDYLLVHENKIISYYDMYNVYHNIWLIKQVNFEKIIFGKKKFEFLDHKFYGLHGEDLLYSYWLNNKLFFRDIKYGISIEDLSKVFFFFNKALWGYIFYDTLLDWESSDKLKWKRSLYSYIDVKKKKIKRLKKKELEKSYNSNLKKKEKLKKQKYNYLLLLQGCYEYIEIIKKMMEINGQEILINLNHLLKSFECGYIDKVVEYIWLDFEINNNNIKEIKEKKYKYNELKEKSKKQLNYIIYIQKVIRSNNIVLTRDKTLIFDLHGDGFNYWEMMLYRDVIKKTEEFNDSKLFLLSLDETGIRDWRGIDLESENKDLIEKLIKENCKEIKIKKKKLKFLDEKKFF